MTDHASLLATIAGLQEQIDSMSGQLTEVRPLQFLLPLPRARCGRGAVPRPAAPTAAAAPPPPHHRRRGDTHPLPRALAAAAARATTKLRRPPPQHRKLIDTGDIDAFWLIFGGVLVFWMQVRGPRPPGIASMPSPSAPSPRAPPVPRARRRDSPCSRSAA